jgi:hypothetical protein
MGLILFEIFALVIGGEDCRSSVIRFLRGGLFVSESEEENDDFRLGRLDDDLLDDRLDERLDDINVALRKSLLRNLRN